MSPPTQPIAQVIPFLRRLLPLLPLLLLLFSSGWLICLVDGLPMLYDLEATSTAASRSFVPIAPSFLSRTFSHIDPSRSPPAPAPTQLPGQPPNKTLTFVPLVPSVPRSLRLIHPPRNSTTTTTTTTVTATGANSTTTTASKSKTFRELIPAPPSPVTVTETVRETAREVVTVTKTVPARLGELEFPQGGYRRTVVLKVQQVRPTPPPSGGDNSNSHSNRNSGNNDSAENTPVYGDAGELVGFLPPASSPGRAGD